MKNAISNSLTSPVNNNISVFAVDDESHGLDSLTEIIQSIPNTKLCGKAKSVREALEFSNNTHIDLLVLDFHLGDGTGLDISEALNLMHKTIIVSADASVKNDVEQMNIPFLLKPISSKELKSIIDQLSSNTTKEVR